MPKHILIADDDADLRQALGQLLELEGFSIAGASDGGAALNLAQQSGCDLILLDATMPGANGLDVLTALHGLLPRVPIIMMSGLPHHPTVNNALAGGASDFITKPFDGEEVLLTVRRALGLPL